MTGWLSGETVPGTLDVLAVDHRLDLLCDCPADEPGGEATDPADRTVFLPHHFDCAAVYAWPAVQQAARDLLAERSTAVLEVLHEHRRTNNVRRCSGCDWRPPTSGRTGDPDAMVARHRQFNEHLANLVVTSLAGC